MRRIWKTLIVILLLLISTQGICGQDDHVILEDYSQFMSDTQYRQLNEDLDRIREKYDLNIYFIFDTSIEDSQDGVENYAESFLKSHSDAANNVAIVMSESYYYVAASGAAKNALIRKDEEIFDRFYSKASQWDGSNSSLFVEGIRDCYQYVVEIVNGQVYQSDAPVSINKALVNDFSNLLSDSQEEKLNRRLQRIRDRYGFDAVIVTTDSFNGMDSEDYSDDFYDYSQYADDGILFVLNMSERSWYVSTKGKAIDYFTDYGIDMIAEEMMDDLSSGNYYEAFVTFGDEVEDYIANGQKGDIVDIGKEEKKFGPFNLLISSIAGLISSLITSFSLKGRMKNTSRQRGARNYVVSNSFHINGASDMLVNRHVSRTRRPSRDDTPRSSSSSHMGGGSSIHTSSSGSSHGGHGGHF